MAAPADVRHVVITGGTRGIGRAIAVAACDAGAEALLINFVQNAAEAERTSAMCEERGARCILHRANISSPEETDRLFDIAAEELGSIDLFVHCAAVNAFKPLAAIRPNQWDLIVNVAARAFLQCAQRCRPLMKGGSIIAVSSLGSRRVLDDYGALGPAKAALESIVRYLACEFAPDGIRVNGVTAGLVDTAAIRMFPGAETRIAEAVARTPAGRIALPEDIADVVMLLASPAARWIVGQIIVADGGLSLH